MPAATLPLARQARPQPVPVSELFYSFQGEGVNLGRRSLFVRFTGCNLTCGYAEAPGSADAAAAGKMLCDTEYTWNRAKHDVGQDAQYLTPQEIWAGLVMLDPSTTDPSIAPVDLIVVSGGEPLLRKAAVLHLATQAGRTGRRMEIETNATIKPGPELAATGVAFNAGLKLATSAVPRTRRIREDAIAEIQASGRARWKFVVCGPEDLAEVRGLQREFGLTEIWLSPAGTNPAAVLEHMRLAAGAALEHGWNLTTRQHVLIWGDERGR
jgi:7-carboxy-7-deazaguanine synthase